MPETLPLREIFIQAGLQLMKKLGPDGLSLSRILAQAKKPRASFYTLFGNKEVFEGEIIRRYFHPISETLISLAEAPESDGRNKVQAWADETVARLSLAFTHNERVTSLTEMSSRCQASPVTAAICKSLFAERITALKKMLAEVGYSSASAADTEAMACLLLVMLDGVESEASINQTPVMVQQYFAFVFKSLPATAVHGERYDNS